MKTLIKDDLQYIFNSCSSEGNIIRPPSEQLDRDLYLKFKKFMTQNHGKWKGGKSQYFEFPFSTANLLHKLKNGERPNFKKDFHYFPTPPGVIEQMCNLYIPAHPMKILEPSAGQGAIVEGVNNFIQTSKPHEWTVVEPHPLNAVKLSEMGLHPNIMTFEEFQTNERFEMIYANPPFKHDTEHVKKMIDLLDKNGSMVVVLPSSFENKSKNKMILDRMEREFEYYSFIKVEDKAFKESGTNVSTVILIAYNKK